MIPEMLQAPTSMVGASEPPSSISPRKRRLLVWTLMAAASVVLLPFLILSAFTHPQNDDFGFAVYSLAYGFVGANAEWYKVWTGRYFATAVMSVSPVVFWSLAAYKCVPAVIMGLLSCGSFRLVSALSPPDTEGSTRWLLALSLVALFLVGMPNVVQGIYWMTGAVTYQLGVALLLFVVASVLLLPQVTRRSARWRRIAAAAFLAACATGTSEVVAMYVVGSLVAVLAIAWMRTRRVDGAIVVVLGAAVVGTAVALASPGNFVRARLSDRDAAGALLSAFSAATSYAWKWLSTGPILPLAILLIPVFAKAARRADRPPLHPALTVPVSAAVFFASFFPPLYAGGIQIDGEIIIAPLETRTVNVMYGFFLLAFFWNVYSITAWTVARRPGSVRLVIPIRVALVAAAMVALVGPSSNLRMAYGDVVSGAARRYDEAQMRRYRTLASCPWDVCGVPAIHDRPETLVFHENAVDLRLDSAWYASYKDAGFAQFFGKRRIFLSEPVRDH